MLRLVLWIVVPIVVAAVVLRVWFVDMAVLGEDHMLPTVFRGDHVLVWRDAAPSMGAIMLCQHPYQRDRWVLGRVVARSGVSVLAFHGALRVGDTNAERDDEGPFAISEPWGTAANMHVVRETLGNSSYRTLAPSLEWLNFERRTVGSGVFLLADYRARLGVDSRAFGDVDPGSCRGRVFFRFNFEAIGSGETAPKLMNQVLW